MYLPIEDKLALRAVLSYWAYKMRHLDIKLTLRDALVYVTNNGSFDYQVNSNKAIDILEGITNRHLQKRMCRTPHPLTEDTSAREWLRDISRLCKGFG